MAQWHPDIGGTVGEYKVLELLGVGGLGVVFKVERAGRFFAMKFLARPRLDGRAKREISVLNHLDNPCCVKYIASDYWPNPSTGHPFIVMEFVPGDTLEAFAQKSNPSARKATRIVLDMARTLGEVHERGVFHRDLKPSNVMICGKAERPVLIDFGVASLVGAACITGTPLPPGTAEFRAPEALRFELDRANRGKRYEFGHSDEFWALGVIFYWLLTDVHPFGVLTDSGAVDSLNDRILNHPPPAPHEVNARVPVVVSRLCMTMLAASPKDRFQNGLELCGALRLALTKADDDPSWDVPLVNPGDAQLVTTAEDPALREANEVLRAFRMSGKRRPRRGQVAVGGEQLALRPEPALPLVAGAEQDGITTVEAPGALVPVRETPAVAATIAPDPEQLAPARATSPHLARWILGLAAALVTVGAVAVTLGFWGHGDGARGTTRMVGLERPPAESAWTVSTDWGVRGSEVAIPWEPAQSVIQASAAPVRAQPPTLAFNAMPTPMTTNENAKSQKQRAGVRLPLKGGAMAAALLAGCTGVGCTATNNQVRTEPPAVTCPQDWRETHKRFKVFGARHGAVVKGYEGYAGDVVRVKDGPVTLQVGIRRSVGNLPDGTLLLGQWQLGDNRIFGTFTEAKIPGEGTLPVCLAAGLEILTGYVDEHGKRYECPPGLGVCLTPGSTPGNVKTNAGVSLVVPTGQP